jgi:hypothetical protein
MLETGMDHMTEKKLWKSISVVSEVQCDVNLLLSTC